MYYAARMLLSYSLSFFLTYSGVLLYNKLKHKSGLYQNLLGGLVMAGSLSLNLFIAKLADGSYIQDGRLIITGFTTYFIGPLAGVITFAWSYFLSLISSEFDLIFCILHLMIIVLYFIASRIVTKLKRNPRSYEIMAYVFLSNNLLYVLFYLFSEEKSNFSSYYINIIILSFIVSLMVYSLLSISSKEKERMKVIDNLERYSNELMQKNMKIEALYNEVSAHEKELKSNINELTKYEEHIEFLAFHERQTGFFNYEKLIYCLRENKLQLSKKYEAMLILMIKDIEKLERTIGFILMDTLHYLVGIEIMTVFEDITNSQIFSISKGKYALLINKGKREEKIAKIYRQLTKRFINSFIINTIELKINIATGGINFTEDILEPEQWLEHCEYALYNEALDQEVKTRIVWFGSELMKMHSKELLIEKELYKALENKEFYLVYQAQFDNERNIIGAEALLRWKHSEIGEIGPDVFIPMAVRNGLIDSIGKVVVHEACHFVDKNRELLYNPINKIPVSVNASFLELINPYYTERFLEILQEHNISSEAIKIEVTESEISIHYEELMRNLGLLNEAGVSVELDDFGTGYSSLNHVGNMPVQTVKIDKKFVDKILVDEKIANIVEIIIEFAHRFMIRTIAEGIETEEQFLWLKARKCDAYQGYYFARPMKEEVFLTTLL